MLSPLRHAVRRSLVSFARPVSSLPNITLNDVAQELDAIDDDIRPLPVKITAPASSPPLPLPVRRPNQPVVLDLPPEEDPLLRYLTNTIMKDGKRKRASRIVSRTLLRLHTFTQAPPLELLRRAVEMASPFVRSMTHRYGVKNQLIPVALSEKQRTRYAIKWILEASKKRSGQTLDERLAREIILVLQDNSETKKLKEQAHLFAMVNRFVVSCLFCAGNVLTVHIRGNAEAKV